MIAALGRIKSYLDYGVFQSLQIAAIDPDVQLGCDCVA